jgi:hypothetical protein
MVLKAEHFGKQNRNTWKVLQSGAGRIIQNVSRADRVRKEEVLHGVKKRGIS